MARKKITSSQVAEKAGVSQATVSMVLNRKNNVSFSAETIEKVENAARELGYELPGRKKKQKEIRKEKLIVVFCPTLTSPYYVLLLQGIESVANEKGYGVFICNTQRDAGLEEKYLRMIRTINPQGIIYACNPHPDFQQKVEELAKEGIHAELINIHTVKPLDEEMVLASVAKTGCAVTAENHSVIGGLGSAVAELLIEKNPVPVKKVGVMDHFGEVGLTPYLKEKYGLTAKDIIAAAKAAIAMKKR